MSAPTLPGTLTITVLDTATIFEGPDTVYRYDLPGTGIIDGWALPAVLDQAKELCSLNWPDVEIIVDADDPTTEVLTRSLLNKGVAAYPTEALRETALPEPAEVTITRPTRRAGRHRLPSSVDPFHVVEQRVTAGDQRDQETVDRGGLPDDHLADLGAGGPGGPGNARRGDHPRGGVGKHSDEHGGEHGDVDKHTPEHRAGTLRAAGRGAPRFPPR